MTDQQKSFLFKKTKEALSEIIDNEAYYAEKIVKVIIKTIKKIENNFFTKEQLKKIWMDTAEEIIDILYEALADTYSLSLTKVKQIYKIKIKKSKIDFEALKDLCYHKDGIYLDERVRKHCLYYAENNILNKERIENELCRILRTESNQVFNQTIKNEIRPFALYGISSGGECCDIQEGQIGEFSEPPYHTNCDCTFVYEVTDDISEIEELDLEDEIEENI